jgi:hypothetical protein
MNKNSLFDLWKFYLSLNFGKKLNKKYFNIFSKKLVYSNYKFRLGNILLIFNSDRSLDRNLLKSVSVQRYKLNNVNLFNHHFHFADVGANSYLINKFSIHRKTIIWIFKNLFKFVLELLSSKSFYLGIIKVYQKELNRLGITSLDLYSSNSRLIELMRIAAIQNGLQVTEYLHGITVGDFADYCKLLDILAAPKQLNYVNMAPGLWQPKSIQRRILYKGSLEVYFKNELEWLPYSKKKLHDILIVGNGLPPRYVSYWTSYLFSNELDLINFCNNNNLKCVYCPHPSLYKEAKKYLPSGTKIGKFHNYINSSKILIGHFSTNLFTAQLLLGKKILIFKEAYKYIPSELLSAKKNEYLFSKKKIFKNLNKKNFLKVNIKLGWSLSRKYF